MVYAGCSVWISSGSSGSSSSSRLYNVCRRRVLPAKWRIQCTHTFTYTHTHTISPSTSELELREMNTIQPCSRQYRYYRRISPYAQCLRVSHHVIHNRAIISNETNKSLSTAGCTQQHFDSHDIIHRPESNNRPTDTHTQKQGARSHQIARSDGSRSSSSSRTNVPS